MERFDLQNRSIERDLFGHIGLLKARTGASIYTIPGNDDLSATLLSF